MKEHVILEFEYAHIFGESEYYYQFQNGSTNMIKAFQLS